MKIRSGFVSNSSSSSFMGGIGVVVDFEKFEKWLNKMQSLGFNKNDIRSLDPMKESYGEVRAGYGDTWSIYMPINSEPSLSIERSELNVNYEKSVDKKAKDFLLDRHNNNLAFFIIGNDEGDSMFGMDGDLDYDIDLDFFPDEQQQLYKEFGSDESGVKSVDKTFGAGRNG